ncbi:prephenate dehydratase domain-containing protein, partial [Candidatus Hakubella thermalkaliphila]
MTDSKKDIKKIYSHPQPTAQCRGWLERNLP